MRDSDISMNLNKAPCILPKVSSGIIARGGPRTAWEVEEGTLPMVRGLVGWVLGSIFCLKKIEYS